MSEEYKKFGWHRDKEPWPRWYGWNRRCQENWDGLSRKVHATLTHFPSKSEIGTKVLDVLSSTVCKYLWNPAGKHVPLSHSFVQWMHRPVKLLSLSFQLLSLKPTSKTSLFCNYFQFHPPVCSQFLSLRLSFSKHICFNLRVAKH